MNSFLYNFRKRKSVVSTPELLLNGAERHLVDSNVTFGSVILSHSFHKVSIGFKVEKDTGMNELSISKIPVVNHQITDT